MKQRNTNESQSLYGTRQYDEPNDNYGVSSVSLTKFKRQKSIVFTESCIPKSA